MGLVQNLSRPALIYKGTVGTVVCNTPVPQTPTMSEKKRNPFIVAGGVAGPVVAARHRFARPRRPVKWTKFRAGLHEKTPIGACIYVSVDHRQDFMGWVFIIMGQNFPKEFGETEVLFGNSEDCLELYDQLYDAENKVSKLEDEPFKELGEFVKDSVCCTSHLYEEDLRKVNLLHSWTEITDEY